MHVQFCGAILNECLFCAAGKELVCGQHVDPVDMRELCRNLRSKLLLQQQQQPSTVNPAPTEIVTQPPSKKNRLNTNGGCVVPTTSSPSCRYQLRSPQQRKSPRQLSRHNNSQSPTTTTPSSSSSSSSPTDNDGDSVVKSWQSLPESAFDLLERCLELNPLRRVSAKDALQHPFLADVVR